MMICKALARLSERGSLANCNYALTPFASAIQPHSPIAHLTSSLVWRVALFKPSNVLPQLLRRLNQLSGYDQFFLAFCRQIQNICNPNQVSLRETRRTLTLRLHAYRKVDFCNSLKLSFARDVMYGASVALTVFQQQMPKFV